MRDLGNKPLSTRLAVLSGIFQETASRNKGAFRKSYQELAELISGLSDEVRQLEKKAEENK
jgi:hypothetical protein